MPFKSVKELPPRIKKLPAVKQRQWLEVFNSSFAKAKKQGKSTKEAEAVAFRNANGVLKNTKVRRKRK